MNKKKTIDITRYIAIFFGIYLFVDSIFSAYKTILFRDGIKEFSDYIFILIICFICVIISLSMGGGALLGLLGRNLLFSGNCFIWVAFFLGLMFLSINFLSLSEWVELALNGKSEYVGICVLLSGFLGSLTLRCSISQSHKI